MNKTFLVPGSFDPITKGHVAMIAYAATLCDTVVVGILQNQDKNNVFSPEERKNMAEAACAAAGLNNVRVVVSDGMTADLYRNVGACAMVRGLRNAADLAYEQTVLEYHRLHNPDLQTVFWVCPPALRDCSSTVVRNALTEGKMPYDVVPEAVLPFIKTKM